MCWLENYWQIDHTGRNFVIFSCGFCAFLQIFPDSSFQAPSHLLSSLSLTTKTLCIRSLTFGFFPEYTDFSSVNHSWISSNSFVWKLQYSPNLSPVAFLSGDFFKCKRDYDTPYLKLSDDFLPQTTYHVQGPSYLLSTSSAVLSSSFITLQPCWPWYSSLNMPSLFPAHDLCPFCSCQPGVLCLPTSHGLFPHIVSSLLKFHLLGAAFPDTWPSLSSYTFFPNTYHPLNLYSLFTIFPIPVSSMRVSSVSSV